MRLHEAERGADDPARARVGSPVVEAADAAPNLINMSDADLPARCRRLFPRARVAYTGFRYYGAGR
jgi:hypothetical protein